METRVSRRSRRTPNFFVAGCTDGLNSIATEDPSSIHYFAYSSQEARGRKKSNKTAAQSEASKESRRSERLRARSTSASSTNSQPPNIFTINDKVRKKYKGNQRPRAETSTTEGHGDQPGLAIDAILLCLLYAYKIIDLPGGQIISPCIFPSFQRQFPRFSLGLLKGLLS